MWCPECEATFRMGTCPSCGFSPEENVGGPGPLTDEDRAWLENLRRVSGLLALVDRLVRENDRLHQQIVDEPMVAKENYEELMAERDRLRATVKEISERRADDGDYHGSNYCDRCDDIIDIARAALEGEK